MKHSRIAIVAALALLSSQALAHHPSAGKIVPEDLAAGDHFGYAVDIDAGTAVASAPNHDELAADAGAVYVYDRSGVFWNEQAKLFASNGAAGDYFGYAVALDGDTLVVGAPFANPAASESGTAYIFVRSGSVWTEQAILAPSLAAADDHFGSAVSISGDTVIVGAPNRDRGMVTDAGAAFVFVRSGTVWTEEQKIQALDGAPMDFFGTAVAVDANRALIGAVQGQGGSGNPDTGAAYLYERTGTTWALADKFADGDGATGDLYGAGVSVAGDWLSIGAPNNNAGGTNAGAAFMFQKVRGTWTLMNKRIGGEAGDKQGSSTSTVVSGYTVVGRSGDDEEATNAGKMMLFTQLPVPFTFEVYVSEEPVAEDQLGNAVAIAEDYWAIAGAFGHDDAGADAGSIDIFTVTRDPVHYCTAGISASGCQATLEAMGVPCANADDGFIVEASNLEGQKDGLYFFGTSGQQALPWGSGTSYRCVVPPTKRGGLIPGTGTIGMCDGLASQDLNTRWYERPNQNPGPGATVQIQFWYRDPQNTSNQTSSLSDAVQVILCP